MRTRPFNFMLVTSMMALSPKASVIAQKIYWADQTPKIARADQDGSNVEMLFDRILDWPSSLQIDIEAGVLYFLDNNQVKRVNISGQNLEVVINGLSNYAYSIALDPVTGDIYWTDLNRIRRLRSSSTQFDDLLTAQGSMQGIALDPENHLMYWSAFHWDTSTGDIYRATMDGGDPQVIIPLPQGHPEEIVVESISGRLYWADRSPPGIFRANADGTNVEQIVSTGTALPVRIAIDTIKSEIYWTTLSPYSVMRADIDGSNSETVLEEIDQPWGIAVDPAAQLLFLGDGRTTKATIQRLNQDGTERTTILQNLLVDPTGLTVDAERGQLYWADRNAATEGIRRMRLDGSGVESVLTDLNTPFGIALHLADNSIYWTEHHAVRRASLLTREPQLLLESPLSGPRGIAFNNLDQKLYWADLGSRSVRRINIDGTNFEEIVPDAGSYAWGIAVDGFHGRLFWTDYAARVCSANLDGSNAVTIVDNLDMPLGIAVDAAVAKIYFGNGDAIQRCDYNGSDLETVIEENFLCPAGVAFDGTNSQIYWVNDCDDTVRKVNTDGSHVEVVLANYLFSPREVAVDSINNKLYVTDMFDVFDANLGGRVIRANLNGSNAEVLYENVGDAPRGIAVDAPNERFIWTESSDNDGLAAIKTAALNGTNQTDIAVEIVSGGLTIDEAASKLYLAQESRIRRSNLDGSNLENIVIQAGAQLRDVAVDSFGGKIYWTDGTALAIRRANTDGTNIETVAENMSPYCGPFAIDLDKAAQYIYWTCHNGSSIRRVLVDGGAGIEILVSNDQTSHATSLALNDVHHIMSSSPRHCTIDARQPHDINDLMFRYGWSEIDLEFSRTLYSDELLDFEVLESSGDGVPPNIESVSIIGDSTVRLALDDIIEPGAWTCFYHINSGTKSCLGYLPGDVNGDGTTSPVDILSLIDSLNGVIDPPYETWQTDINRSGAAEPADILRLIDLLNGASKFEVWNGRTLGACP